MQALRGVDLTIHTGDWVAIVGPSGSGKSTLLNILGCLDRPTAGSYVIDGIDASGLSEDERASLRAQSIGFVFQTFHLLGHRTALENVMLADIYAAGDRSDRAGPRTGRARARGDRPPPATSCPPSSRAGSSSGWRSRGRCSGSPRLLLCDEPTGNLDTANTESVLSLFDELANDGLTFVVITHDEDVAERARRAVRIVDGQSHGGDSVIRRFAERLGRLRELSSRSPDRQPASGQLPQPRMELRDLFSEAAAGLIARPARVGLTVLGTVIGVAALVATLGLSKTAGNQIVGRFDQVAATDVVVTPVPAAQRAGGAAVNVIPWDAEARMKRLNGVAQAGTLGEVNVRGQLVRSVPINDPAGPDGHPASGACRIPGPVAGRASEARRRTAARRRAFGAAATAWRCWASTPPAGSASRTSTSSPRSSSATACTR